MQQDCLVLQESFLGIDAWATRESEWLTCIYQDLNCGSKIFSIHSNRLHLADYGHSSECRVQCDGQHLHLRGSKNAWVATADQRAFGGESTPFALRPALSTEGFEACGAICIAPASCLFRILRIIRVIASCRYGTFRPLSRS